MNTHGMIDNMALYLCLKRRSKYLRFRYVPPVSFAGDVLDNLNAYLDNLNAGKHEAMTKMTDEDIREREMRDFDDELDKVYDLPLRDANGRFARK